jgi:hypothetical protein
MLRPLKKKQHVHNKEEEEFSMILYSFATLLEERNRLNEKWNESGKKPRDILLKIRQVEVEIRKQKEFFFPSFIP